MPTDAEQEAEASYFAMCLLMPQKFVLEDIQAAGGHIDLTQDEVVLALAKKYQVPVALVPLRFQEIMERIRKAELL